MQADLAFVFAFTFVIHLTSTTAYAVRIAGVRTGRIAVALALFNVLALASRTANSFQAPLLAKHIEEGIAEGTSGNLQAEIRVLLLAAPLATLTGALLIPTARRLFGSGIERFAARRSLVRAAADAVSLSGLRVLMRSVTRPRRAHLAEVSWRSAPAGVLAANVAMTALLTVGVFASLYAGSLHPDLRVTANTLSPLVNGFATLLLFLVVDPYLSVVIDDVMVGQESQEAFRRLIGAFAATRLLGAILAQALLVPGAEVVGWVARQL